jgi:PAS domain S-box-containing protein
VSLPAFSINLESGVVLAANAAGRELLGLAEQDALIGCPVAGLLPGVEFMPATTGTGWLRMPNRLRRYVHWLVADCPDRPHEGLLVVHAADDAELDVQACKCLTLAQEDFNRGASLSSIMHSIASMLHVALQLRAVRVLLLQGNGLQEETCIGDQAVTDGTQRGAAILEVLGPATDPALRAVREGAPILTCVDSAPPSPWKTALEHSGVHSVQAWPLALPGRRYVFEMFADGVNDLSEMVAASFLRQWLPWFQNRLASGSLPAGQRLVAEALTGAATPAFITDTEGAIVWVNRAFTETYGRTEQEALGAKPRLIKSGVHGQRYYRALWTALRSGRAWSGETVDRGADGREVIVQQTITPVRHGGYITHFLSIHANITEDAQMRAIGARERGIDEITGLMTREAFADHVQQVLIGAAEDHKPVALLLCAIVTPNGAVPALDAETLAHVRGVMGQRLRESLDAVTVAGSLAPFDFAVLLRGEPNQAAEVARAIAEAVREPLPLLGSTLQLTCRSAQARFPEDGKSFDELRLAADGKLAAQEPDPLTLFQDPPSAQRNKQKPPPV